MVMEEIKQPSHKYSWIRRSQWSFRIDETFSQLAKSTTCCGLWQIYPAPTIVAFQGGFGVVARRSKMLFISGVLRSGQRNEMVSSDADLSLSEILGRGAYMNQDC